MLDKVLDGFEFLMPHHGVRVDEISWGKGEKVRLVRDDLLHPVAGGNKLRKLDALLPRLRAEGTTDIVTCGGIQSAHCAAVAALAAELGIRAHLLLRGERPEVPTGYTLLSMTLGHVTFVDRNSYADREALLRGHRARVDGPGRRVAVIPEGAGVVDALPGVIRLVHGLMLSLPEPYSTPWRLVVDSGTGTTAVGLALGVALAGLDWEVYGVRLLSGREEEYGARERELLASWNARHGAPARAPSVLWTERVPERRFGSVHAEDLRDCVRTARETGVIFDPIWTWAAWRYPEAFRSRQRRQTVVIHTGGLHNLHGIAQRTAWPDAEP